MKYKYDWAQTVQDEEYKFPSMKLSFVGARKLTRLAKALHKMDEAECNGLEEWQEANHNRRMERLEHQARSAAADCGFALYRQTDPRGASLYVIPLDYLPSAIYSIRDREFANACIVSQWRYRGTALNSCYSDIGYAIC